jgi:hypothetical protein
MGSHNLHSSPNFRATKSRRMKLARHVARMCRWPFSDEVIAPAFNWGNVRSCKTWRQMVTDETGTRHFTNIMSVLFTYYLHFSKFLLNQGTGRERHITSFSGLDTSAPNSKNFHIRTKYTIMSQILEVILVMFILAICLSFLTDAKFGPL